MVAQNSSAVDSLAALTSDERLIITTLVEHRYDLHPAAAALKIAVVDLLLWLEQPRIRDAIDILQRITEQAVLLRILEARRTAIDYLEHAARTAQTALEQRRAAAALARAVSAPLRTASSRERPSTHQPPSPPEGSPPSSEQHRVSRDESPSTDDHISHPAPETPPDAAPDPFEAQDSPHAPSPDQSPSSADSTPPPHTISHSQSAAAILLQSAGTTGPPS